MIQIAGQKFINYLNSFNHWYLSIEMFQT